MPIFYGLVVLSSQKITLAPFSACTYREIICFLHAEIVFCTDCGQINYPFEEASKQKKILSSEIRQCNLFWHIIYYWKHLLGYNVCHVILDR